MQFLAVAPLEDRFSPDEEVWHIPFSIISTGFRTSGVSLAAVRANGKLLPREKIRFLEGSFRGLPVFPAGRYLPSEDLVEWHRSRLAAAGRGRGPGLTQLSLWNDKISFLAEKAPPLQKAANEMMVPAFLVKTDESVQLEVLFQDRRMKTFGFRLTLTLSRPPGYPVDPLWVAGDLHIHSIFSDGRRSLSQLRSIMKGRGYHYIYLSDGQHTKRLLDEDWDLYREETRKISDQDFCLFPGVETAAGSRQKEMGHLLVFGTNKSIAGLEEHSAGPQELIDAARENEPSAPSFPAIAHPLGIYRWRDYTVTGHRGMEVMSGALQMAFRLQSGPSRLWRRETARHMDRVFVDGNFPAPFTGTDWHGYWFEPLRGYVTWTRLSSPWGGMDYQNRKKAVDESLFKGRVVASLRGSLGFFRLQGEEVGSIIGNVPAGSSLPLYAEFRAARRGIAHIYVVRNNLEELVFRQSGSFAPGQVGRWQDKITFPGGRQSYWLYVAGSDYLYSSPIFVSEGDPCIRED